VTDWNPLTIWIYETPYLRLGAEDYSLEKLNNLFIHLTNNSIAKNSKLFINSKIEGNMLSSEDFQAFLKEKCGNDVWENSLKEKIKQLVIWSLESAQDVIENRKNSHEIFGFDIMIDDELNPWLIEINSSPCMEYSTVI
jgi:hypothetical protein